MTISYHQFVAHLLASRLMTREELATFEQQHCAPSAGPPQAHLLAHALVEAGRLTKYQASAIYQERPEGLVLGEYTVLEKIGSGGMGHVYKAVHARMGRQAAIKVLPSKALSSPGAVHRFQQEVRAAARLTHPNIVITYDASQQGDLHYLVMELVEGEDLAALLKKQGPLPVHKAVDYIQQAARGLEYAHREGIVHRDIKPGNLMIDRHEFIKVLDLGLAHMETAYVAGADENDERLTNTGQVMGTCDYMAPEQAEDTSSADHRADIYSLGCTLYRLLTGDPPYVRKSVMQVMLAHRDAPIPSLREKRPDVPEWLDVVYQKMLAKRAYDRHQSMGEVIKHLQSAGSTHSQPATPKAASHAVAAPAANVAAPPELNAAGAHAPASPATPTPSDGYPPPSGKGSSSAFYPPGMNQESIPTAEVVAEPAVPSTAGAASNTGADGNTASVRDANRGTDPAGEASRRPGRAATGPAHLLDKLAPRVGDSTDASAVAPVEMMPVGQEEYQREGMPYEGEAGLPWYVEHRNSLVILAACIGIGVLLALLMLWVF